MPRVGVSGSPEVYNLVYDVTDGDTEDPETNVLKFFVVDVLLLFDWDNPLNVLIVLLSLPYDHFDVIYEAPVGLNLNFTALV